MPRITTATTSAGANESVGTDDVPGHEGGQSTHDVVRAIHDPRHRSHTTPRRDERGERPAHGRRKGQSAKRDGEIQAVAHPQVGSLCRAEDACEAHAHPDEKHGLSYSCLVQTAGDIR